MTEISNYAKYRVTGPGAEAWLSSLLTARMPAPGRITLTAMLNDAGPDRRRVHGRAGVRGGRVLPVRLAAGGGPPLALVPPPPAGRRLRRASRCSGLGLTGLSVAGPRSRDVLAAVAPDLDLSTEAFPFMTFRKVDLGMIPVHLARINYAGDLGYELWVPPQYQRAAVRPDHGGRRAARPAPVRDARAHVAAAREELRDVVPRVPAHLHAARGRDHALHQARPRLHRARRRTSASWPPARPRGRSWRWSSSRIRTTRPTSSATSPSGTATRSSAG